jgi:hypothetical protein
LVRVAAHPGKPAPPQIIPAASRMNDRKGYGGGSQPRSLWGEIAQAKFSAQADLYAKPVDIQQFSM